MRHWFKRSGPHARSLLACILLLLQAQVALADPGWFGVEVKADGSGRFWNPVIESLTIVKVGSGSPADLASVLEGEEIVEVEGLAVSGARMRSLQPLFEKSVGETINLMIQSANGETRAVSLTGAIRPFEE